MKEKKPFLGTVIAVQIVLFILMSMIPQCHGGPGERDHEGRAMSLVRLLKQGVEHNRIEHKAYPRDLTGIKYKYEGVAHTITDGVRDARSAVVKYETGMGKVTYGPMAGKEAMYELRVWAEDTDEEYYAYTGDPFLYLKRIPKGLGIALPALLALSLFLSIWSIIRLIYRRAPEEGPRRITASQVSSFAASTVFIVAALALLFASFPRSKEPLNRDFLGLRNIMTNAQGYYHDHKRYPRDLHELAGLIKGPIWLPYGYTIEYGPIGDRPNEYALRAISRDRDVVYEMYTDKAGLYSRKKEEKEDAAKLM